MNKISHSTILLLSIFYVAYVVTDYTTTQWLIANDPNGISNEANPLARFLYGYFGLAGMLGAKSLIYLAIALTTIFIEARYQQYRHIRILKELTILALIGYSLAVVVNNSLAVFVISALKDSTVALWMVKTYGIILSLTLTALISLSYFSKSHRKGIEIVLTVAFLLMPIWVLDKFYPLIFESYLSISVFIGGLLAVITVVLLLQSKFKVTAKSLSYS